MVAVAVLAPLNAYAGDLDLPPPPQLEAGNTGWLELAQEAGSISATALPFVEQSGQNIPVWWIAPVAWYAGKAFGWQAGATTSWLDRVWARQLPSGGWGLGYAWDWRGDGTVNPASTTYTITTAGHVGRMLIDGYDDGAVPRSRVLSAVTSLLNTSTTAGGRCISYSMSPNDANKPCVYNVNATAAWFLWSAYRRGIIPAGREEEHNRKWRTFRDYNWTAGFSDAWTGWAGAPGFPYEQGQTVLQDPWHHAATVWPLYEMDPATGIKAINGHFTNYSSSANADLVVYDCGRIASNLLSQARGHAFPASADTQAEKLQAASRWTIMALRVHRACYSVPGEPKALGDYDGDGKGDFATWRRSDATWSVEPSTGTGAQSFPFGRSGDIPLVGDVDGDGLDDAVTWRESDGTWRVRFTSGAPPLDGVQWGLPGDIALLGDVDGDSRDDFIIRRPSGGTWYVRFASGAPPIQVGWGSSAGDIPLVGDVDGDGLDDLIIWSRGGAWFVKYSGAGVPPQRYDWGLRGDIPLLGDVNGDGRDDFIIRRPATLTWWVLYSSGGSLDNVGWGGGFDDVPLAGDLNGDGRDDLVIYARHSARWYVWYTSGGTLSGHAFGQAGDVAV